MNQDRLNVRMLGGLSLTQGGQRVDDSDNRTKKVWLLLSYMIYNRGRSVSQEELIALLWGEDRSSTNPLNALKTMFHRVRSTLDRLFPSAGHTLIIRRDGGYAWNSDFPCTFDVEEFDRLCRLSAAAEDDARRLEYDLAALELYRGDFLPKLSSESWVIPISAYYHNLYLRTAGEALELLEARNEMEKAAAISRRATEIEPYDESLYQHLMRELLALGDLKAVIAVYQGMSDLLFSTFGIMPSDESKALYRQAARTSNDQSVTLGFLREQLREGDDLPGALFCEYDFFRIIYRAEARSVARTGDAVHIGLITVTGHEGQSLSKRSMDVCMENLKNLMCLNLRRGDVAARCSVSQYIVMLPQANYENACMVMERIVRAFFRQYPHSPAQLRYSVQPLEPN
ncbi:AfsR/SARP family transcriptional regulator [Dysosmobacter sp.]|uniref:AfsR/SARP family transcriptional regulator n=1 Tax=Dysosmobacter sp. TaxID=2591382 RepID=UPI002A8F9EAC|nr:BTAD domain-containing putative transcriptional regulator [Dysosmobacter sp.]MDY3282027.1 BTAD domain-containing putative transcriptional regulator [Dysosmobacter sp.]